MKRLTRWTTMAAVAATALVLGLSSASASAPPSIPAPALPGSATGQPSADKTFTPFVQHPAKSETLFYPVTPCRVADTRHGGGSLADLAARSFYVRGTTGFAGQGGHAGGCGIPTSATAIAANVTVAGAGGSGYLAGYAAGTPEPGTNFVTYGGGQNITANPILPLAAFGAAPHLTIRNHGSSTHVIIDVTGYYAPQIQGMVDADSGPYSGSTRILASKKLGTGTYQVTVDSDVTWCTPTATPYATAGVYASSRTINGNKVLVNIWVLNPAGAAPVLSDTTYFYLTVSC